MAFYRILGSVCYNHAAGWTLHSEDGPKKGCMIGGALCGLGLARGLVCSVRHQCSFHCTAVIGGLGVGIAYGCPIAVSAQWFPDKRGLAVGLTVLGFGFSAALISYATLFLKWWSYQIMNILQIFGIAFFIITVVASMYLRFPPAGWKPAGWTAPAPKPGAAAKARFHAQ